MADKRKRKEKHRQPARRSSSEVRVRQVAGSDAWELLHPRCALERAEDIEEVEAMLAGGETEIAVEELRWLLSGCTEFIQAHRILGQIALEADDVPLARGHFGTAYRIGISALKKAGWPRPLPYAHAANQDFLECGKGLLYCLKKLGKKKMAAEVVARLLECDPSDPLGVGAR